MKEDSNKSQEENKKEIDDFLNQFNRPDEVEDSFNEITDRFGKSYGAGEPAGQKELCSSEKSEPKTDFSGRSKRHRSQKSSRTQVLRSSRPSSEHSSEGRSKRFTGDTMARSGKKKKKKYKINGKRLIVAFLCLALMVCSAAGVYVLSIISKTPHIDTDDIYSLLSENSVLYDASGNVLENITKPGTSEIRTNISYSDLPEDLVDAFVAIEDKTFWSHNGFNFVRIIGAIVDSLTSGEPISGTSTLTQQLARNLYLSADRAMGRKIQEAWYALQLEKEMTKEQILEAYLNTINLGYGAWGVQAASQAYFSKDVSDLNLAECAALATIPKSPTKYALLKGDSNEKIEDPDALDIVSRDDSWTIWYNDTFKQRQLLVLKFMLEQGKITQAEHDEAAAYDMRQSMKPGTTNATAQDISSYFADYTTGQVIQDLMKEYNLSNTEARDMLYTKGLRIYSTIDLSIQKKTEDVFGKSSNFPEVRQSRLKKDKSGNILNSNGNILLYNKANYFNSEGSFVLSPDEYRWNSDGSLTLLKGKRLNFYNTKLQDKTDVSVEFKNLYTQRDGQFYSLSGGVISIGSDYKKKDSEGNLLISAQFFADHPKVFLNNATSLSLSSDYYSLRQEVMQPQSAMVIMDYHTGQIKAMVGGRSTSGKLLYNRATSTRQPGSSFKPIGVYGPAIDSKKWTAASVIDDAPMTFQGKQWPKNWYNGFRGLYTLRTSVEQSVNVNAVKVFMDIGLEASLNFAKKLGITSILESGSTNDLNASAMALGGMTNGVSPLEMAAAYGAFANGGVYTQPICYTKVTDKKGTILLEKKAETHQAMHPATASIMTDILRTTVTNGLAKRAAISGQPVAGKTGTTTDNYDAWFVGFTPYYSAAVWIGNDVNLELNQGSASATRVWQMVMNQIHSGLSRGSFTMDSSVVSAQVDTKSGKLPSELSSQDPRGSTVRTEYFLPGTVPIEIDDVHVRVDVCNSSGYLATPWCTEHSSRVMIRRPGGPTKNLGDSQYDAPIYYCNHHNVDTATYPVDPSVTVDTTFVPQPPEENQNVDNGDGVISDGNENQNGDSSQPPVIDSGENPEEIPEWLR